MITANIQDRHKRVIPIPKKTNFHEPFVMLPKNPGIYTNAQGIDISDWMDAYGRFVEKSVDDQKQAFVRLLQKPMPDDAYMIELDDGITVTAGGQAGFRYALNTLWQMNPDGQWPKGVIEDAPRMKMRGFHINFDSFRQMDIEEALRTVKEAAMLKCNTVLVEYADRFPYEDHPSLHVRTTLSKNDIKRLNDTARAYGVRIIPLQQSIGHLEYIFKDPKYRALQETEDSISQCCPRNPESFTLIRELIDEMIDSHPDACMIHLGGDEARHLGVCPECKEYVNKYGVSKLYVDHINRLCEHVIKRGITPILWDDMLCAHPEALDNVHRDVIIMAWDYWAVSTKSPYFVARYDRHGGPVQIADVLWKDEHKRQELNDVERSILDRFASYIPLSTGLSKAFMERYGAYLGDEFPERIRAFPYIEYFKDQGFRVIAAPTALGNGDDYHSLPNVCRFAPNIKTAADRAQEADIEGMITTAWYNYHPSTFRFGLHATAQFAW